MHGIERVNSLKPVAFKVGVKGMGHCVRIPQVVLIAGSSLLGTRSFSTCLMWSHLTVTFAQVVSTMVYATKKHI